MVPADERESSTNIDQDLEDGNKPEETPPTDVHDPDAPIEEVHSEAAPTEEEEEIEKL